MPTLELEPPTAATPGNNRAGRSEHSERSELAAAVAFDVADLAVRYGTEAVLQGVTTQVPARRITAIIGPSGCGKSTFLRCLNRMNDLVSGCRVEGTILHRGTNLHGERVDPVEVRRRIGMVFQKPTPFPKSIFDNVAYGLRLQGRRRGLHDDVEEALRRAALWDEVRDRLRSPALGLSGGQQQRLCIARAIAVQPDVLLLDEPCSALDPIATARIEQLLLALRERLTIVLVTHNLAQAERISDHTAFFAVDETTEQGQRVGTLVEQGATQELFSTPNDPRTLRYLRGHT